VPFKGLIILQFRGVALGVSHVMRSINVRYLLIVGV